MAFMILLKQLSIMKKKKRFSRGEATRKISTERGGSYSCRGGQVFKSRGGVRTFKETITLGENLISE